MNTARHLPRPALRGLACILCCCLTAVAQKDLRDRVLTTNGGEVRGRVLQRYAADEVVVVQGGKRVRVPKKHVTEMRTVLDSLREFFGHRHRTTGNIDREWMLAEWAQANQLPAMARLQAMHVLLLEPEHEAAHRLLDHRKRGKHWMWKRNSSWMTLLAYEAKTSSFGTPKILDSEHFVVRTNTDLRRAIDALFDLERFYVDWYDTFGEALHPREILEPLEFHLHASAASFPAFTVLGFPYYFPHPNGNVAYTFFAGEARRPDLLFQLASEQLLYNALADGMSIGRTNPRDRLAAWVEIGMGQWCERRMQGPAGYAEPAPAAADRQHARTALHRETLLTNLLGRRYGQFHEPASRTLEHWALASSFVSFLLDAGAGAERRKKFLTFVRDAYAGGKGSSTSLLDRALGEKLEAIEPQWQSWLQGVAATRSDGG